MPWDRQSSETRQAFEAFQVYRDLGEDRSLTRTAAQLAKHWTLIARWSARWSWVSRVEAWDKHLDEINQRAQEQKRKEMAKRHANLAMGLQGMAAKKLTDMQEQAKGYLKPADVAKFIEVGVKVERLARGEPDTVVGGTVAHKVLPPGVMSLEELRKLGPDELARLHREALAQSSGTQS
ncbi:MAG TPA: hypothetical protein VMX75_15910 [Spirochaetia bacterium]|nr:hypothetical protein [Spirochaetia bacterium]